MSVIKFPEQEAQTPKQFLKQSAEIMGIEEVEKVLIACKCKDGQWVTGYFRVNFAERMEGMGHIQADTIDKMILENAERYKLHEHPDL